MKFNTLLLSLLVIGSFNAKAQGLWSGLNKPQSPDEQPVSRAAYHPSTRKAPQDRKTVLQKSAINQWIITQGWRMSSLSDALESPKSFLSSDADVHNWYNAVVPGTVLTTLVDNGVYPNPYYGLNNWYIPDTLCRQQWVYRCEFDAPEALSANSFLLQINGINYKSDIFLNNKKLGTTLGAFIRGEFDITPLLQPTNNTLAIIVTPPFNPGIPHEQSIKCGQGYNGGILSVDGPTFISSIGWDWIPGIRDRNTGIWQDVRIKSVKKVRIDDPQVITKLNLPDTTLAEITINVPISNLSSSAVEGKVNIRLNNTTVSKDYRLQAHEAQQLVFSPKEYSALTIKHPRLWWPNGYGRQDLYPVNIDLYTNKELSDTYAQNIGIRDLSYELMYARAGQAPRRIEYRPTHRKTYGSPVFDNSNKQRYKNNGYLSALAENADTTGFFPLSQEDPMGEYLVLKVNGVRIFCRGGNWGMDDGMKNSSISHLEPYFALQKNANFNIIRNWTGESTQESFYELCDKYGLLVWNDFWITTDDTVGPLDFELFANNAKDVIIRYRNHPCIAIWCPRNEGFAPEQLEEDLQDIVAKNDPTRHYHGQSRFLNMPTSGPWGYFKDPSRYFTATAKGFNTEMGSFAIPTASTIRKFIPEEDRFPINDVWAYHDLHHTTQNFPDFMDAVTQYGDYSSMEAFAAQSQLVCYDAWRVMLEAWNSRMWNNTSGLIFWMSHPAWPSMIWQTYTYDCQTPGSYFGAKKAAELIHVQLNLPDDNVMVVNNTATELKKLRVEVEFILPDGSIIATQHKNATIPAHTAKDCFSVKDIVLPQTVSAAYLVRCKAIVNNRVISVNDYIRGNKLESLQATTEINISTTIKKAKNGDYQIRVKNNASQVAFGIKLGAFDSTTNQEILPALFSDGYFNLVPNEVRTIVLKGDGIGSTPTIKTWIYNSCVNEMD